MDGKMEELVDLPVMCPILDICRLGTSGQLSDLHRFKKLYLSAKVPGMGKLFDASFALALVDLGLQPPNHCLDVIAVNPIYESLKGL